MATVLRIAYLSEGRTPHDQRFLRLFAQAGHAVGWAVLFPDGPAAKEAGVSMLYPSATTILSQAVAAFRPDVIVAGPLHTAAFAAAVCGLKPLVAISWGSDVLLHAANDPSARQAAAFALRHAAGALADAAAVAEQMQTLASLPPEGLETVPWGVDLARPDREHPMGMALRATLGLRPDDVLVFSNRALAPLYRPLTAVRAFAAALPRCPQLFLYLAGNGPLAGEVRTLVRRLGIADRVCLGGWLNAEGMAAGYAAADVYLSCSSSDGSSISLLEAMAAGLPVVVTDIPGNREWVAQGDNGFLGPVDDVQTLAGYLADMAARPAAARAALGRRSRAIAEARADWRANGARILDLLARSAAGKEQTTA